MTKVNQSTEFEAMPDEHVIQLEATLPPSGHEDDPDAILGPDHQPIPEPEAVQEPAPQPVPGLELEIKLEPELKPDPDPEPELEPESESEPGIIVEPLCEKDRE